QRLENEVWDERGPSARRDPNRDGEAISVTHAHDVEVTLQQGQLFSERYLVLAGRLERRPKQIGKLHDHPIGRRRVGVDQRRDAVERIEKKMRPELAPQDV